MENEIDYAKLKIAKADLNYALSNAGSAYQNVGYEPDKSFLHVLNDCLEHFSDTVVVNAVRYWLLTHYDHKAEISKDIR